MYMTFLQNHPLQLNGNRIIVLCMLLMLSSCFSSKKSTRRGKNDRPLPERVTRPPKPKLDTVDVRIIDNPRVITDNTPYKVDRLPETIKKDRYKVSLLIPFKADVASATA